MSVLKGLIRETSVYGLGAIAGRLLSIVVVPIYTRVLPPDQYGLLALATTTQSLLLPLVGTGSYTVYSRFFFEGGVRERRALTVTWFGFLAVWSLTVCSVLALAASPLSRALFDREGETGLLLAVLIGTPIALMTELFAQIFRNRRQAGRYTGLRVGNAVLTAVFGVFAVTVLDLGPVGIIAGSVAANLVVGPVSAWMGRDLLASRPDPGLLRKLLAFGLPLVPTAMAIWIFTSSDRYLLRALSTVADVGLYSVAVAVASPITLLTGAVGQAWFPRVAETHESDPATAGRLISASLVMAAAVGGAAATLLAGYADVVIHVLASSRFDDAAVAIGPLVLGGAAFLVSRIAGTGLFLTGRTGLTSVFTAVAAVVNVAANLLLIPEHGFLGAAWATAIAYACLAALSYRGANAVFPVHHDRPRLVVLSMLTVAGVVTLSGPAASTPLLPRTAGLAVALALYAYLARPVLSSQDASDSSASA